MYKKIGCLTIFFILAVSYSYIKGQTIFIEEEDDFPDYFDYDLFPNPYHVDGYVWSHEQNCYYELHCHAESYRIVQYNDEKHKLYITFFGEAKSINQTNNFPDSYRPDNPQRWAHEQWVQLEIKIPNRKSKIWRDDIQVLDAYRTIELKRKNNDSDQYEWVYENKSTSTQNTKVEFILTGQSCAGGTGNPKLTEHPFESAITFTLPPKAAEMSLPEDPVDFKTTSSSKSFKVENDGGQTLTWNSSKSLDGWFDYDPPYGDIAGYQDQSIDVTVNRANIDQDSLINQHHYGFIEFSGGGIVDIVEIKVSIPVPATPQNLQIGGPELGNPTLTWNAVSLVYRYKVERRNITLGTGWQEIASVSENTYTDNELCILSVGGDEFQYRVKAVNGAGSSGYSNTVSIEGLEYQAFNSGGPQTLMPELPEEYKLESSYPNPGNPGTTIRFQLPEESRVVLKVFNVRGEAVITLINEQKAAGHHEIYWDGRNDRGTSVVTGMYIIMMEAGGRVFHKKFSLIK